MANTYVHPRTDGDVVERGIELAQILMTPRLLNAVGLEHDLRKLAELAECAVPLQEAKRRAELLIRTDTHRDLRWRAADALLRHPSIDFDPAVSSPEELRRALERVRQQ